MSENEIPNVAFPMDISKCIEPRPEPPKPVDELDGGIILEGEEGAVMGESAADLRGGIDAGVLYLCAEADGQCPNERHRGPGFLHYRPGKGWDDYVKAVEGP